MRKLIITWAIIMASFVLGYGPAVSAGDNHEGYYYPKTQSQETYLSRVPILNSASKRARIGFTVGLNAKQLKRSYPPSYHIFAKGGQSQKLIIVAVDENRYNTLFRLRALLAALTASARTSPLFTESNTPEELNFLDLCKMAGFTQVTISNGRDVTHQIIIV
jgi:hypothetical protein